MIFTKDKIERMQADAAAMRKRREKLAVELGKAERERDTAASKRSALLMEQDDAIGTPVFNKVDAAYTFAENRRIAIEGAMRELAERIQAVDETIAGIRDANERARLADRTEARAAAIEKAAAELDEAGSQFFEKRAELLQLLARQGLDAAREAIIQAAVRLAAPGVIPTSALESMGLATLPIGAVAAAAEFHVGPLRATAAGIRTGDLPAVDPALPPAPMVRIPAPDDAMIVLSCPCFYRGALSKRIDLLPGGCSIPAPVANAAAKLGVGFQPDSHRGAAIMRELQRGEPQVYNTPHGRRGDYLSRKDEHPGDRDLPQIIVEAVDEKIVRRGGEPVDLGVDLHELEKAERARIEAERVAA